MSITKATAQDAGCWIDGHWGQYGVARMVELAAGLGYGELPGMAEVIDIAARHLASMGPSTSEPVTDDEHERLSDASDEVEDWLNANVAPEGYSFGWHDGEFYLWSEATWGIESY